jgi:hypothetical protein
MTFLWAITFWILPNTRKSLNKALTKALNQMYNTTHQIFIT